MALNIVDSKKFASVSTEQFARLAAKAGLPEKITLDAVKATVEAFRSVWPAFNNAALEERTRHAIDQHLASVPLWRETLKKSRK